MTLLKSIVAGLVLANVGYFLWARGIAATPGAAVIATPSLTLASEARGGSPRGGLPQGGLPQGGLPQDGPSPGGPPQDDPPAGGSPQGGLSPAPATPTDPALEGSGAAAAAPMPDAAPIENPQRCVSVGPFREVSEAARAAGALRTNGYDTRQRVADGEVWAGVWVYLPLPQASAAADQILEKLKSGGIDDALEMPGPNDTSVISLGLFSEQKRAQARVAQAQALSLNPAVADRKRNGSVYWIDIDLKPDQSMPNPGDLQGESSRILRLEVKECPPASKP